MPSVSRRTLVGLLIAGGAVLVLGIGFGSPLREFVIGAGAGLLGVSAVWLVGSFAR